MIKLYPLIVSVTLFSCFTPAHLGYLGNTYTPTRNVDVYVDGSAIKKPYRIMGKTYMQIDNFTNLERVQHRALEKAKQKGADAILFQDYILQTGNTIETVSKTDSTGITPVRIRTTTSAPVETTRLDILFLKYE